jgi:hypothetical protein
VVVGGVHVGAGFQQRVGGLEIVPMSRPKQGRDPIRAGRVHIHATLFQERSNRRHVLPGRRLDDPDVRVCRRRS